MAQYHKFNLDKGATWRREILYLEDDKVTPIDITGYTARMHIRRSYGTELIHELTTENGGITITGALGQIDLVIEATDTDLFIDTVVKTDLEIITGTEVTRIIEGDLVINENITV